MLISISLNNSTVLVLVKSTKVRANSNSNSKLELDDFEPSVFKVQKMPQYALYCLIMGVFKGEVPAFAKLWPIRVR